MRERVRGLLAGGVVLAVLPALPLLAGRATAQPTTYVPAQFIAKQYTEGLGRMPDQAGWRSAVSYFTQHGCSAGTLASYGEALFGSTEYAGLRYDDDSRILTLYRAALNREPDAAGVANWTHQLGTGLPWATAVRKFYTSGEFTALVPAICSGVVDGSGSSYYFGTEPPIALPTIGAGFTGSEQQLQAKLDHSAKGGTVALARRAVIELTTPLRVPPGVTLETAGLPDPRHYATMARLVRAGGFARPAKLTGMVQVEAGATLSHVWVDGTRDRPGNTAPLTDVMTYGTNADVVGNVIGNTQAPNTVYLLGGFDGYPCASQQVSGNLVTAYSSDHYQAGDWSDGISDNCEGATITSNQVVDATDVAIVVYRDTPSTPQRSVVSGNYVLSAGNSMYGGLGFDPLFGPAGTPEQTFSFAGGRITDNTLWSGPDTHYDIGITDGSRAWFAGTYSANTGVGASITGNTTGTLTARVQIGVGVNGMLHTTVSGNRLALSHTNQGRCPKDDYAAEISAGHASGTFSPRPTDVDFDGCV